MASRKTAKKKLKLAPKPAAALERPPADLPYDEFVVDGRTYRACFDIDALEEAEFQLRRAGNTEVEMLALLPDLCMRNLRILFAAATQRFHGDIPYTERKRLLGRTPEHFYRVGQRLADLWRGSMPQAKDGEAKASPLERSSADASGGSSSTASAASTSD